MEANQYIITHKELIKLLIKHAGVHEGRWMLLATVGFSAGNFGPNENEVFPGGMVVVQNLGIQRAEANSPAGLTVDAAEVNPAT